MKINYQISCVALIIFSAYMIYSRVSSSTQEAAVDSEAAVYQNMLTRTSVRSFKEDTLSEEQLEKLLKAGMSAPTAGNMQPWEFIVVTKEDVLKKIRLLAKEVKAGELGTTQALDTPALLEGADQDGAAAFIVVMANMDTYKDKQHFTKFWVTDTSIATQNILLAAHSMGLGAVWLSIYPSPAREEILRGYLDIPANKKVLCMIALGYPKYEKAPKDKWKAEKVQWVK